MFTERTYAADGFGPYAIGFDYLESDRIRVQWLHDGTVQDVGFVFEGTPSEGQPSGTSIRPDAFQSTGQYRVFKDILMDDLVVDWNKSAALDYTNLRRMSRNLMEMAQTAYDKAVTAFDTARDALSALQGIEADTDAKLQAMQDLLDGAQASLAAQVALAEYWAQIALDAGSVANPEQAAAEARDEAIAARNAAQAAQALAENARDAAVIAQNSSVLSAADALQSAQDALNWSILAQAWAEKDHGSEVVSGSFSAKHWAIEAQQAVLSGNQRWSGSLKFVSTLPPDNSVGANGDFWIQREV